MKVFLATFIFSLVLILTVNEVKGQCTAAAGCDIITTTNVPATYTVASGTSADYNVLCIAPPAGSGITTVGNTFKLDQYSTVRICTSSPTDTVKFLGDFAATGGGGAAANDNTRRLEVQGNVQFAFSAGVTVQFSTRIVIDIKSTGTLDLRPSPNGANPFVIGNSDSIYNSGKIISNGPTTFNGPVANKGSIVAASINVGGGIKNYSTGTMSSKINFTLNSGSNVLNYGTVTSDLDFTSSTGSNFSNYNFWNAKRDAFFSGTYNNSGVFQADKKIQLNGSGLLNFVNSGLFDTDSLVLLAGTLQTNATCAVFRVKTYSSITSGPTLNGASGSVAIYDLNNPGIIDNVVCSCGGIDFDGVDNAVSAPNPASTCNGKPSGGANTIAAGPYCGIVPISSLSGGPSGCFATLPVVWLDISAKRISQNNNLLTWTVEEDGNNTLYQIEYSTEGSDFKVAGQVKPYSVKSQESYSFNHENQSSDVVYYRVKQVDKDGRISYSSIVEANGSLNYSVYVSPNPGTDLINLYSTEKINSVEFLSMDGRLTTSYNLNGNTVLDVSNLSKGVYILKSYSDNGNSFTKFVKN